MRLINKLRLRLRSLVRGRRVEQELNEEFRYHLERLIESYVAAGMPADEARYAALREMGPIEQQKERCRDVRGLALLDSLRQDVRYALRALRRSPGFTAIALSSLAFGIGANTTIFTFVNAVLLRPLPYPGSDRLVVLREQPIGSQDTVSVHPLNFIEWRTRAHSFETIALVQTVPINVLGSDGAEQLTRIQTTSELFRVFGVAPVLGREFTQDEMRPGGRDVVILGYGFWQRWFAGDPAVLGRQLAVSDGSLTIVGVAPPGLRIGLTEPDVYSPLPINPANPRAIGSRAFQCYARLKADVTLEGARAEMTAIGAALARQYPLDEHMGVFISGLHDYLVREGRPALQLLMAVVATVLVISCVNLAGLLLARGLGRRSELALRASLGASRARLVTQLVIESLVVSLCGGAVGLFIAYWATRALVSLTAGALTLGTVELVRLDVTCLVFTLGVSTVTALAFGLVPAWQASGVGPQTILRQHSHVTTLDRSHYRMRNLLVVGEVTLAVVLLVGAGLLLRSFANLMRVKLGFQPAQTITMGLFLGGRPPESRAALVEQILDRVEALPGVKAASTIQFLPLTGSSCGTGFWFEGQAPGDLPHAQPTNCSLISRGYFTAMGIAVLNGRPFDRRDHMGTPRVVVVNQSFARRYVPDGRLLGRRILVAGSNQALAQIIGVVGDIRHNGLTSEPMPTVFLLHAQTPGYITNLVARTTGAPGAQATAIRRAVQEVDPTQAVSRIKTMEQYLQDALARPRLYAVLITLFAVSAVMLAAIGVYGLIAYIVTQRTHEISIRLALGAAPRNVFIDLFGQGARLVGIGLCLGVTTAIALRGLVSALLFGIEPGDPWSYLTAAMTFLGVALAAVTIPAGHAARVDPIRALRYE